MQKFKYKIKPEYNINQTMHDPECKIKQTIQNPEYKIKQAIQDSEHKPSRQGKTVNTVKTLQEKVVVYESVSKTRSVLE